MNPLRRNLLAASGALLFASLAKAQIAGRLPALGSLSMFGPPPEGRVRSAVIEKAIALGWREGETIRLERAYGDGTQARLAALAGELLDKKVDVIWAADADSAVAAARATKTVPIVFFGVAFAVEQGLANSLARPGKNATGVSFYPGPELIAKKLEFLQQAAPKAKRVALLVSEDAVPTVGGQPYKQPYQSVDAAARGLKLDMRVHRISEAAELDAAFAAIVASRAQAVATVGTMLLWRERQRIVEFVNRQRLPSAFGLDEFAEAGGLLSYGPVWADMLAHTFDYVDKIFKGARPGELPIEQPTRFELVLNRAAAKTIGLALPQTLLLRADRTIE